MLFLLNKVAAAQKSIKILNLLCFFLSLLVLFPMIASADGIPTDPRAVAQAYLTSWYEERVIPGDAFVNNQFQKVRPKLQALSSAFPKVVESNTLPDKVIGKFDELGVIQLKCDLNSHEQTTTLIHEGTHYYDLSKAGLVGRDLQFRILEQNLIRFDESWNKKQKADYDYISTPEEMHARIMVLRWLAGFKPDQEVQKEELSQILKKLEGEGALTPGAANFETDVYDLVKITRDSESIRNLLNLMN